MGSSSWITSGAVAAVVAAAGAFAYMNRDCDTCLISSVLGKAQATPVSAEAPAKEAGGCCPLTESKTNTVLASQEVGAEACTEECADACAEACAAACAEACEVACEEACEDACESACEATEEIAASGESQTGNG